MKLIIAGGRDIVLDDKEFLRCFTQAAFMLGDIPSEIVSGGAKGIDAYGEKWGKLMRIPVVVFDADWNAYGKAAGPIRNKKMAEYATHLLLIWDGRSRGSADMKRQMEEQNKPVIELLTWKALFNENYRRDT